jgi:hypothetical protein
MKHQIINENFEKKKNEQKLDWGYERFNRKEMLLVEFSSFLEKKVKKLFPSFHVLIVYHFAKILHYQTC